VRRLLATASAVPSSPILVIRMKEKLSSSETSVLTRATQHNIPEGAILHSFSFSLFLYYSNDKRWAVFITDICQSYEK
jgi:hypothetical protein